MKPILATFALLAVAATPLAARAADYVIIDRFPTPLPQVWVEPEYRTVMERVYVPAEYKTVWIELDGRMVQARVTVHEAGYSYVERRICVVPGHWVSPPYPVYPVDPPVVVYRDPTPVTYAPSPDPTEHGTFSPTYEWPK